MSGHERETPSEDWKSVREQHVEPTFGSQKYYRKLDGKTQLGQIWLPLPERQYAITISEREALSVDVDPHRGDRFVEDDLDALPKPAPAVPKRLVGPPVPERLYPSLASPSLNAIKDLTSRLVATGLNDPSEAPRLPPRSSVPPTIRPQQQQQLPRTSTPKKDYGVLLSTPNAGQWPKRPSTPHPDPVAEEPVRFSTQERKRNDNLAELFAIISSIEHLEKAYMRDCVAPKEYTVACARLLSQYKAAFQTVSKEFPSIEHFMQLYKFDCPAAMERIKEDIPVTIRSERGTSRMNFITIMDKLQLQMTAVDEIFPDVRELLYQINRLSILLGDYLGRVTVTEWVKIMSTMHASAVLDDKEVRQLLFDLESAYAAFQKILHEH